jgi:dTDP-4-amino-4,6-dideoxygalactose transaminase
MPSSSRPEPRPRRKVDAPEVPLRAAAAADELRLDELMEAVACVALRGDFVGGTEVDLLERRLAWLHGHRHATAMRSGDEATRLALTVLGVGPGATVALPAACPPALAAAVAALGAEPVWVPVDPRTASVTPAAVEATLAARPACLVLVHLFGATLDATRLAGLAAVAGVPVLEDVSHAVGARHGHRGVGGAGAAVLLRLGPDELLEAWGDTGVVATSDPALAERLAALRSGAPDTVPAAVARRRLLHLERDTAARAAVARALSTGLAGSPVEPLGAPEAGSGHAWHRFVVRTAARDELHQHLKARGVASEAPALAGPSGLEDELLALPAWAGMSAAQVRRVIVATAAFGAPGEPGLGAVTRLPTRP